MISWPLPQLGCASASSATVAKAERSRGRRSGSQRGAAASLLSQARLSRALPLPTSRLWRSSPRLANKATPYLPSARLFGGKWTSRRTRERKGCRRSPGFQAGLSERYSSFPLPPSFHPGNSTPSSGKIPQDLSLHCDEITRSASRKPLYDSTRGERANERGSPLRRETA